MQFKNPEILYFLFLLIIPVLVHLFQLRRFKKEYFTNVRFLRELSIQTRKSSKLKKYLLLASRMLLLAAIVTAFSQPYFPAKQSGAGNELFIVLDNSHSMQARGKQGELLRRSIEELLQEVPEGRTFSLLTNDDAFWDTDIKSVRPDLQQLPYSALAFDLESQMARIGTRAGAARDIVIITDAVGLSARELKSIDTRATVRFIVPKAEQKTNVSIDSVFIEGTTGDFYQVGISIKSSGDAPAVPVALYNRGKLIAKTQTGKLTGANRISLTLPKSGFHGFASVTDNGLAFDNRYYFSISPPKKVNVLAIGDESKAGFMRKIYTPDEFNFANAEPRSLDYNLISRQDAVILNEPDEISPALLSTLEAFGQQGGTIIAIPSASSGMALNPLLGKLGGITLSQPTKSARQVTRIAFGHPLFAQVFEKKIDNFQYPTAQLSYTVKSTASPALSFEDGRPFLASGRRGMSNVFAFASPLSREHGNFQSSPLIVPTFYNMARIASRGGLHSAVIGDPLPVLIDAENVGQGVLEVRSDDDKFIPLQQLQGGAAKLTFTDNPKRAGNYEVFDRDRVLAPLSFNYDRQESYPAPDPSMLADFETAESVGAVFDQLESDRTGTDIWKWFVILALLFAAFEVLIQKFVK